MARQLNERPLSVLMVNTADSGGGAERIVMDLVRSYRDTGVRATLAVGRRTHNLDEVVVLRNLEYRGAWARGWYSIAERLSDPDKATRLTRRLQAFLRGCVGEPVRWVHSKLGHEDFDYPGTSHLLSLSPEPPDILHIHNMHGKYFDLRALSGLSRRVPTWLTLHDAWMLSGHCAHSMDCDRWRTGCGSCPDLRIYPAIDRDGTAYNWRRKRRIYEKCQLYVATPSEWLMSKVKESILASAILEARVIPNGVDTSIFRPGSQAAARAELGLPANAKIVLFTANGIRHNMFKDYATLRAAMGSLSIPQALLIGLGEDAPAEHVGTSQIQFVPYQKNSATVARYYQAADVYAHPAHADTFPSTVLEALACGTPVVATAVGGIPEQIKGLELTSTRMPGYRPDEATGILVPRGDSEAMASAIQCLLSDSQLRRRLSENAAVDVRKRFTRQVAVAAYLAWYEEIISRG